MRKGNKGNGLSNLSSLPLSYFHHLYIRQESFSYIETREIVHAFVCRKRLLADG